MPVNTKHKDYSKIAPKWKRCRDVYAGQDAIHEAGIAYLPKLKDQTEEDYKAYVQRATFYNATYRSISGMVGMLFRQPPQIDAPEQIMPLLDDVTLSGVPFHVFLQEVADEVLEVGRIGILVDYPTAPAGLTQADAQKMNLRPTMQLYETENIINWKTERVNNQTVLTLVVLTEVKQVPEDEFKVKEETQYRVLDLVNQVYRVRLFKIENEREILLSETFPKMGGAPLSFIPFVFIGVDDVSEHVDEPPLIDLVDVNLSHYRTNADLEHGAHFTGLPTAVVAGYKPENPNDKLYIGSQAAWVFPSADAHASFLEFSGQGLDALQKLLDRKESQMAILGARMLEPQKRAVEAADTESMHRKGEESMLAAVAQTISIGATRALEWFTLWAGAAGEPSVELNRDFFPVPMTPAELGALVSAWQQGAISDQTLFENLQQGEVISKDKTLEEEQAQIEEGQQKIAQRTADFNAIVAPNEPQPGQGA